MTIARIPGLTHLQTRQMYAAIKLADDHADDIDTATQLVDDHADDIDTATQLVDDHADDIDTATQLVDDIDSTPAVDLVDTLRLSLVDPTTSLLTNALRPTVADAFKPSFVDAFKPPWLNTLRFPMNGALGLPASPAMLNPALTQMARGIFLKESMSGTYSLLSSAGKLGLDFPTPGLVLRSAGVATPWESLLPRIDLPAFAQVHASASILTDQFRVGSLFTDMLAPHLSTMFSASLQSTISSLFSDWRTLADFGHTLAGTALGAALSARRAVLRGKKEVVKQFARLWLGIKSLSDEALDAVMAALLDDAWLEAAENPVEAIRRLYRHQYHPTHRPIWETRLRGTRVGSLNAPVGEVGTGFELVDLIAAPEPGAYEWRISDPRALAVVEGFSRDEQLVLQAKFGTSDRGMTWAQAADDCGFSAAVGESVRRKLRRASTRAVQGVS